MGARILPHPFLSVCIAVVWVLLANELSAGHVVLGIVIGLAIPKLTSPYWPERALVRRISVIPAYLAIVIKDIIVSSALVAYWVLFRRGDSLRSQFVTVPLDLRSPEAISALAGTITLTPGTLTADLSADGRCLLVHCLETSDPAATVVEIKQRYERRLKEIFE